MKSLYGNTDELKVITTDKKVNPPIIERVQFFFNSDMSVMNIPISDVKSINVFSIDEIVNGYIYFKCDTERYYTKRGYFEDREINAITVFFDDKSKDFYKTFFVSELSQVENSSYYIMVFIAKRINLDDKVNCYE